MKHRERIEYLEGKVQMLTAVIAGLSRNRQGACVLQEELSRLSMKGEEGRRREFFLQGMEDARNGLMDMMKNHLSTRGR